MIVQYLLSMKFNAIIMFQQCAAISSRYLSFVFSFSQGATEDHFEERWNRTRVQYSWR